MAMSAPSSTIEDVPAEPMTNAELRRIVKKIGLLHAERERLILKAHQNGRESGIWAGTSERQRAPRTESVRKPPRTHLQDCLARSRDRIAIGQNQLLDS